MTTSTTGSTTGLSVNLNAIAQLRNRRDLPWPSVTDFGRIALNAGAVGLTIHPRPDQRHIRFSDVPQLQRLISEEFPDREYNIEGYPTDAFLELAESASPHQITLVPDDPAQAHNERSPNLPPQPRPHARQVWASMPGTTSPLTTLAPCSTPSHLWPRSQSVMQSRLTHWNMVSRGRCCVIGPCARNHASTTDAWLHVAQLVP